MSWNSFGQISHCRVNRIASTNAHLQSDFLTKAITDFLAPGPHYEIGTLEVGDDSYKGFVNSPQNLRDLYRQGLEFEDSDPSRPLL